MMHLLAAWPAAIPEWYLSLEQYKSLWNGNDFAELVNFVHGYGMELDGYYILLVFRFFRWEGVDKEVSIGWWKDCGYFSKESTSKWSCRSRFFELGLSIANIIFRFLDEIQIWQGLMKIQGEVQFFIIIHGCLRDEGRDRRAEAEWERVPGQERLWKAGHTHWESERQREAA